MSHEENKGSRKEVEPLENKYKNKRVTVDGIGFDSMKEARRYKELAFLQKKGYIKDLELQKKFVLIPKQMGEDGKVAERECSYVADFYYVDTDTKKKVIEDVKGYRDGGAYRIFSIKRKLVRLIYGIAIKEI